MWNRTNGCSVTANAPSGYSFSGWEGGNTANPRSFPAQTSNASYTADFSSGQACTFTLSSTSQNTGAGATTGMVNVTATTGCAWLASSNASWITVSSGASGTGNGTVGFSIAANTTLAARTGTLTIAGTTFTVNQSATTPTALQFVPITPCRVADTRSTTTPNFPSGFGPPELSAGGTRNFAVPSSSCNMPSSALAYSLNVTVVPNASLGYLTVWAAGQAQPNASTLNSDGRIKANAAIVPAGGNGQISVYATDSTQLILDINGYFVPAVSNNSSALSFHTMTPCRLVDTRSSSAATYGAFSGSTFTANSSRAYSLTQNTSGCSIPASAKAYSLNYTVVPASSQETDGYLTTWPSTATQPTVSTLNYTGKFDATANTVPPVANAAIVPAGDVQGDPVSVFVSEATDVIIDINGYFAPPADSESNALSMPLSMYNIASCRTLDTRPSNLSGTMTVPVAASVCAVSSAAQAYVFNATVTPPSTLSYLTLWPNGQTQPTVSTLNAADGAITSNMAIVPTSNGSINAFSSNPTPLILDISSYFAP